MPLIIGIAQPLHIERLDLAYSTLKSLCGDTAMTVAARFRFLFSSFTSVLFDDDTGTDDDDDDNTPLPGSSAERDR